MRSLFAVILLTTVAGVAHAGKSSPLEYVDLLSPEVVGEFDKRTYDVTGKVNGSKQFLGQDVLRGGLLLGGGVGIRAILRFEHGVRISVEGGVAWGHLRNADTRFAALSRVTRAEFLSGIGYEFTVGEILVLHSATMLGLDANWLDAAGLRAGQALVIPADAAPPAFSLSSTDLRLGQQVGAHLQLASIVALFADATFDYDGQWRIRAGLSLGRPVDSKRSTRY